MPGRGCCISDRHTAPHAGRRTRDVVQTFACWSGLGCVGPAPPKTRPGPFRSKTMRQIHASPGAIPAPAAGTR